MEREAELTDVVENPLGAADTPEEMIAAQAEQIVALEGRLASLQQGSAAAVLASLSAAPTNWHQATIYFLTTKAERDAGMRKAAPLMFAGGLLMVLLQTFAVYGVLASMLHPSCVTNKQCDSRTGFYCFQPGSGGRGNCQMCGESAPLVPYLSDERVPDWAVQAGDNELKEYNVVWDLHYPPGFMSMRAETPDFFAGWNFTMVADRCSAHPVESFSWEHGKSAPDQQFSGSVVIDRGDIDRDYPWLPSERIRPRSSLFISTFTSASAARWCAACVHTSECK